MDIDLDEINEMLDQCDSGTEDDDAKVDVEPGDELDEELDEELTGELQVMEVIEHADAESADNALRAPEPTIDVSKYHGKLDEVTDKILASCDDDRKEVQSVIDMIKNTIEDTIADDRLPRKAELDAIVKAMEVKAGINSTAVKMMEAVAKMLAVTKSVVPANSGSTLSSDELVNLLDDSNVDVAE